MHNFVAVDYKVGNKHELSVALSKYTGMDWEVYSKVSNDRNGTLANIKRYLLYFWVPLQLFFKRKSIANLVVWQQFYGILFAFYCKLFKVRKTTGLIILTFMYSPKKGLLGKVYERFMMFSIKNKYVDLIVCFSQEEVGWYRQHFDIPEERICFMPVAVNRLQNMNVGVDDRRYVFSAGYSGRDYEFLINSLNNTEYTVLIADNNIKTYCADNVTVVNVNTGKDVMDLMAQAYCVVIPLKNKLKSAGHLVALWAMQMGKPVICTDSCGMHPYINNGENGLLIENTKESLCDALNKLYSDKNFYEQMSASAVKWGGRFSFTELAHRLYLADLEKNIFVKTN